MSSCIRYVPRTTKKRWNPAIQTSSHLPPFRNVRPGRHASCKLAGFIDHRGIHALHASMITAPTWFKMQHPQKNISNKFGERKNATMKPRYCPSLPPSSAVSVGHEGSKNSKAHCTLPMPKCSWSRCWTHTAKTPAHVSSCLGSIVEDPVGPSIGSRPQSCFGTLPLSQPH